MKKQNLVYKLKDMLLKQFFFDDAASGSLPRSLAIQGGGRRRPPMGTSFVISRNFGDGDPGAVMSLEISSGKIVALIGILNMEKQIQILGFGEQVFRDAGLGPTRNIMKTGAGIRAAVKRAVELSGVTHVHAVYTNYSGILYFNRLTEVFFKDDDCEEIEQSDIETLKEQILLMNTPPGEETILIQPEYFTIDGLPNILNPVGMAGKRIEARFGALLGEASVLRNIERCVSWADLHLTSTYPSAIASAEAVLMEEEKEGSIAVIDIGASMTHIAVFEDGLFIHAETLPIRISSSELASVMEVRVEDLISLAYSKVMACFEDGKPAFGIVITGGGVALFPNIEKLVKQVTGARCYVGIPDLYLAENTSLPADLFERIKSPVYATGIGLLKMGLNSRYY